MAAAVAEPVPAALQACVRITQDSERLACFDREIAALAAGSRPAVSAGAGAAAATAAAAAPSAKAAAPAAGAAPPAASAAAPTAGAAAPTAGAHPLTAEEEMGLSAAGIRKLEAEKGISPAAKPPKELTAHLASVSRNSAGRAVFTLDNGQVWRQSETRQRFEARAGEAVKITPGGLGSFWLSTDAHNQTRVVRVVTP
jgi:pyruvate/2-oxoglutarate dehydrogenase complex dihydrolipoamide acyltransferase (E2) component